MHEMPTYNLTVSVYMSTFDMSDKQVRHPPLLKGTRFGRVRDDEGGGSRCTVGASMAWVTQ